MKNILTLFIGLLLIANPIFSQTFLSEELMKFYTAEWTGERTKDGRPKVSDELLKRLKNISKMCVAVGQAVAFVENGDSDSKLIE